MLKTKKSSVNYMDQMYAKDLQAVSDEVGHQLELAPEYEPLKKKFDFDLYIQKAKEFKFTKERKQMLGAFAVGILFGLLF